MYLRNAWYVAEWSSAIERNLTPVTILGEQIVLYRTKSNEPVALEDACCHRKLPLSMGRLVDDRLQCGYHGLEYDGSGVCVKVPGQTRIPRGAKVRSYPVIDRWGLIWIWMGNPAQADPATILHVDHYDDPNWGINRGPAMDLQCNYLYMLDNLLDPSHVTYVHGSSLGDESCADIPLETIGHENSVVASRWIRDHQLAPFFRGYVKFEGNADRLQYYEVRLPSHSFIKDIVAPAGSGAPEGNLHEDVFLIDSYNLITPVSEARTRYFWFQLRNFKPTCQETTDRLNKQYQGVFEEDLVVLAAVEKGMRNKTANIDISIDAGGAKFRRLLSQRIEAEDSQSNAALEH
jgi:phenylpropionate dioxygenase-like ring-hydroxylating dioxygenase large terminal subunit